MIVTCQRDSLLNACQIVSAAVPSRTPMPVYQNIKAIAEADCLTILATDLDVGIRYEIRGLLIEEPGQAIWPVTRLIAILRETSDSEIRLDSDLRRTHVNTSASDYEMPAEDPASFADFAEQTENAYFEMAAGDLQRMIRRTVFAAAKEEGKYSMRGVLWDMEEKLTRLVATDGKRLAVATLPSVAQNMTEVKTQSHHVSIKAMQLLERILGDSDAAQPVQVTLRTNDAIFRTDRAVIYSRLMEGNFPPYRTVIPKKFNARVPLVVGQFLSAVRQAAIMTDDESKRIAFAFTPGKVTLEAQGASTGKSKVVLKLPDFPGPPITISFDPLYLTEFLKVIDGNEVVQLDLVDANKSVVFRSDEDYLYLVVPLV